MATSLISTSRRFISSGIRRGIVKLAGSGPLDDFSTPSPPTGHGPWDKMVKGIQNTQSVQMGWDILGHIDIPHTPFTFFGLFQQFLPNTRVAENPLDFQRYDLGVQWRT